VFLNSEASPDQAIVARRLTTSKSGEYVVPLLAIGNYDVSAEAPGFETSRQTAIELNVNAFLEEALVTEVPGRQGALLILWGMGRDNLLDFAISHELGHALCNEKDEGKAKRVAGMLREEKPASCEVTLQAKGRRGGNEVPER